MSSSCGDHFTLFSDGLRYSVGMAKVNPDDIFYTTRRDPSSRGAKYEGNLLSSLQKDGEDKRTATEALKTLLDEICVPLATERIAQQCSQRQIHDEICKVLDIKSCKVSVMQYVMDAGRRCLLDALNKSAEEAQADSVEVYNSIIRDPTADNKDVIAAQSRKDKLLNTGVQTKPLSQQGAMNLLRDLGESMEDAASDE